MWQIERKTRVRGRIGSIKMSREISRGLNECKLLPQRDTERADGWYSDGVEERRDGVVGGGIGGCFSTGTKSAQLRPRLYGD